MVSPVDYVPWPENGCSLAEARERTADRLAWRRWCNLIREPTSERTVHRNDERLEIEIRELGERIGASCLDHVRTRRLIGYGCTGRPTAARQLICSDDWPALTKIDWEKSLAADNRDRVAFFDIRVFPPLLAPCRIDLLAGCSLSEVFRTFILGDAEVAALATEAVRLSPDFERVFVQGRCHVHGFEEWPLAFDRWSMICPVHPDPEKRSVYDAPRTPDPLEVVIAAEALIHRYRILISMLRRGELNGQGLPTAPGHPDMILRSIWSHDDFHLNATSGDVLQDNPESENRWDRLTRRWIGVVLQKPNALVGSAQTSLLHDGERATAAMMASQTNSEITDWLRNPPFTIADVLAVGSLSEALTRLVFSHPGVRALCAKAIAVADQQRVSFEENAGLVVLVSGHDEPLLPLRYFPKDTDEFIAPLPDPEEDPAVAEYFDQSHPPEIEAYYEAVKLRASTLIEMLQGREVLALGHTADGHLMPIAHSIWSHEYYYIHPPTGDIYEAAETMTKKWTGAILVSPSAVSSAGLLHVKPPTFDVLPSVTTELQRAPNQASKAMVRMETSSASYKACVAWLREIMLASPKVRTESRDELLKEAKRKWPGTLSSRAFLDARNEAIRATGAIAWAAAGAPKKSQRLNRRAD
jgi:hypothetical protein